MPRHIVSIPNGQWLLNACVHVPNDRSQQRIGIVMSTTEVTKFGRHALFRQVADAFADSGFYVIRYDNRGTNDSPGYCDLTFDDRVADACAVTHFFKTEYDLDTVLSWGLCLGGAVAVHASSRLKKQFKPAAMALCSLLIDPAEASVPEFNYRPVTASAFLRNGLTGSPFYKLGKLISDAGYRTNASKAIFRVARAYFRGNPKLQNVRSRISQVGPLLAKYEGPTLLVYGDNDSYWSSFTKRINAGDKLALSKMKSPPKIAVVSGADHEFRSAQSTCALIQVCISWATAFRDGQTVAGHPEELQQIFGAK